MRKKTLAAVCFILATALVLMVWLTGRRIPLGLSPLVLYLVLLPLLLFPAEALNKRLLAWRKARGRDIEQEEEYEIGSTDFISLRPRSERPPEPEENKHLPPLIFR
jgi:hypothetical protein